MKTKLILVRGLPGSGKSTLAKELSATNGYLHFEADDYFNEDGVYNFRPEAVPHAHSVCQDKTRTAIRSGKSVVVANTFCALRDMEVYFDMASAYNCDIEVITLEANYGSIHNISESTVERMRSKFQTYEGK